MLDASTHSLLTRMLDRNPNTRITATQCLQHSYFSAMEVEDKVVAEEEFYSETPLMKKDTNETESIKLSIKPSIHEDSSYLISKGLKAPHAGSVLKSISKENAMVQGNMLKPKKMNSQGPDMRSKEKRITNNS